MSASSSEPKFKPLLTAEKVMEPSVAWAPYERDADRPWDLRLAGHLYRRAGFGGNWDQLQAALADGPRATVDKLLAGGANVVVFNTEHDKYEKRAAQSGGGVGPQAWWLRRMCETPRPLLEQMTVFWHNYFGISNTHLNNPSMVCRHIQELRQQALGKFDGLLEGVLSQPAVFLAVGAPGSRKARPNENLARVLLERFTVGPGGFTEVDLQATAQVLSGWFVSQNELQYAQREHSSGQQKVLGETGDFDKSELAKVLSRQRATAYCIVTALYRWFISETNSPDEALLAPIATRFATDLDISKLVETMLRSNLFFSTKAYRQKIKSPVEFALGIIRSLGGMVGTTQLAADLAELGQDLYNPPTIKGWSGSRYWIDQFTMLGRMKLAKSIFETSGAYGGKLDPLSTAARHGCQTLETRNRFLFDLLLQGDLLEKGPEEIALRGEQTLTQAEAGRQFRSLAAQITSLPEFNLA